MEKVKSIGYDIVITVKKVMEAQLREMEEKFPGSISLSSGGCNDCANCTRGENHPCRFPEKMRYSLDAFGFDLTAISKEMFHIDIQWCQGTLPEYFTLIHALLKKE